MERPHEVELSVTGSGAYRLLVEWLETGPVPPAALRRVLVLGTAAGAEIVARNAPAARVDHHQQLPVTGERYDLVAVLDRSLASSDATAVAACVEDGGVLVVITAADPDPLAVSPLGSDQPSAFAVAGLHLVAFEDLASTGPDPAGRPRWLRITYRRTHRW